mgnify:CR=1 FL=1|tara:strand:- start:74 stop:685 length:612 start_codon:yes stop_codon:yes gene_type:complete
MQNHTAFQRISLDAINTLCPIYRFGWSGDYIVEQEAGIQAVFLGDNYDDARYEVIDSSGDIAYLIFRAGQSFYKMPDQLFNPASGILLVNAAGNLYRYDCLNNCCLDNSCYALIDMVDRFDDSFYYFASKISESANLMVVVDGEGVAAIDDSKVLWKRDFEWAYADYIKILSVTGTEVEIEDSSPDGGHTTLILSAMTGEVKS